MRRKLGNRLSRAPVEGAGGREGGRALVAKRRRQFGLPPFHKEVDEATSGLECAGVGWAAARRQVVERRKENPLGLGKPVNEGQVLTIGALRAAERPVTGGGARVRIANASTKAAPAPA